VVSISTRNFIASERLTSVVVLLDEADVFLEQRSLDMLERNALVSGQFLYTSTFHMTADISQSFCARLSIMMVSHVLVKKKLLQH
jgi:hypothetical protein